MFLIEVLQLMGSVLYIMYQFTVVNPF